MLAGRLVGLVLLPGVVVVAAVVLLVSQPTAGDSLPGDGPWVLIAVDRQTGADAISVIYLPNRTISATVRLDCGGDCKPFGLALSPTGNRLYVSNSQADSVSVIDLATLQVTATWSLTSPGDSQVRTPRELAVSPDGSRLYVSNQGAGTVSVLDTATGQVVAETPVGLSPRGIDFLPDGRVVVVTQGNGATPGGVSVLSPVTHGVVLSRSVPSGQPIAVKVVGDRINSIFVLEQPAGGSGENQVDQFDFDLQSDPKLSPFPVGNGPVALVYDSRTLRLYVACGASQDIWMLDLATRTSTPLGARFQPNPPTPFSGLAFYPGPNYDEAQLVVIGGGGGSGGGQVALAGFVAVSAPGAASSIEADPGQSSLPWGVVVYTKPTPVPSPSPTPVPPAGTCADPSRRCLFLPVLAR